MRTATGRALAVQHTSGRSQQSFVAPSTAGSLVLLSLLPSASLIPENHSLTRHRNAGSSLFQVRFSG
jgi:hypothetical protein